MPNKGKLPPAEKVKVVQKYLSGELSVTEFERCCSINRATLYTWVRLYKARGIEGLMPASKTRKYSPELKQSAVAEYLSGGISLRSICAKYDINTDSILQDWIKVYNSHKDFKQPNSGGVIYMAKGRKTTLDERIEMVSRCIAENNDYGKIIEQYGVSYQQIYGWMRKYEKDGVDGLTDRRGKRKSESEMSEVEKLWAQIKLKDAENLRLQMENELLKKLEELERGRGVD